MAPRNRYFRFSSDEGTLRNGIYYLEFAPEKGDWYALRQIETDGDQFLISSLARQNCGLYDQHLSDIHPGDPDDPMCEIGEDEFEEAWRRAMRGSTSQWSEFKQEHPAGSVAHGRSIGFYPQGVYVEIGEPFFGLLDYRKYRARHDGLGVQVSAKIVGFDDKYRWALLELV